MQRLQALADLPFLSTTQISIDEEPGTEDVASRVLPGDFSQLFVGVRTDLRIEILKERFADSLQYGFLAWLRADVQLAHPESFCQITGIVPATAE